MSKKRVVLIIPSYNEAENIKKTISVVFSNFPKEPNFYCHILVADDSSPDGTSEIVRKLIPNYKNLHLVTQKEKNGLGPAYYNAMNYAFSTLEADYVFEFDADLSHDPKKIPLFLEKADQGFDYVIGTRYRGGGKIPSNWGLYRKFLSVGGNLFIRLLFLTNKVSDWTSGYKLISKKVFTSLGKDPFIQKGYTFQIAVSKKVLGLGYKIAEIPYEFVDREKGKSKLGAGFVIYTFIYVVKTRIIDFITSSFFKVCLVGTVGAIIQITTFAYTKDRIEIHVAHNLSIFLAIVSNYLLNNFFSFRVRRIQGLSSIIKRFPAFFMVSLGSLIIQNVVMVIGLRLWGFSNSHENILNVVGILIGLVFNFTLYNKVIWKKTKK